MLRHPTVEKLQQLKLPAMARELTERSNRRLALKLRQAKLRHSATLEDLDTRAARGLDKALIVVLATCSGSPSI